MNSTTQTSPIWLRTWQQNLHKLRIAQEDLINSDVHKNYDLLILQELYIHRCLWQYEGHEVLACGLSII